jgi:excisionase family DNA binding protein
MEAVEDTKTAESEIMTTSEVAQYLRLSEATIYKLAQSGEIPAVKVGRNWRFKKGAIDGWFEQQANQYNKPERSPPASESAD